LPSWATTSCHDGYDDLLWETQGGRNLDPPESRKKNEKKRLSSCEPYLQLGEMNHTSYLPSPHGVHHHHHHHHHQTISIIIMMI